MHSSPVFHWSLERPAGIAWAQGILLVLTLATCFYAVWPYLLSSHGAGLGLAALLAVLLSRYFWIKPNHNTGLERIDAGHWRIHSHQAYQDAYLCRVWRTSWWMVLEFQTYTQNRTLRIYSWRSVQSRQKWGELCVWSSWDLALFHPRSSGSEL